MMNVEGRHLDPDPPNVPPGRVWCRECRQTLTRRYYTDHRSTIKHMRNARGRVLAAPNNNGIIIPPAFATTPQTTAPSANIAPMNDATKVIQSEISVKPAADCLEECGICMDNKIDCVLIKCGHMNYCFKCATEQKNRMNGCPICRKPIEMVVKVFKT